MFDRFTDRSRRVMLLARAEAESLGHDYIGTEHMLLGLSKEGTGIAGLILKNFGLEYGNLRNGVRSEVYQGAVVTSGDKQIPFTPRARKSLEYAIEEASNLDFTYIGTEHILLGIIREGAGLAFELLRRGGLTFPAAHAQVMAILESGDDLGDEFDRIIPDVKEAYEKAVAEHGSFHSAHEGYGVMLEEFDELWDEIKKKSKVRSKEAMVEECEQIAAMAIRFIVDICDG